MNKVASMPVPPLLYKYRAPVKDEEFGWIEAMIREGKYFFGSPKTFNDLFDCKPVLSYKCTDKEYVNGYVMQARKRGDRRLREALMREANGYIGTDLDPRSEAFSRSLQEGLHSSLNKWGVFCLADSPTNLLMWAHYAASYSGICLGINPDKFINIQPVTYQLERPIIQWLEGSSPKSERGLLTKSELWKYENEWRSLHPTSTTLTLGTGTVREVYFGPNCKPDTVERIKQIVAISGQKIELARLIPNRNKFGLDKISC